MRSTQIFRIDWRQALVQCRAQFARVDPVILATSSSVRLVGRMRALSDWLSARFTARLREYPVPGAPRQ